MNLFAVLLLILPHSDVARDYVDLIEVNHFYDCAGRHVFNQLIAYDWTDCQSRFNIRGWRMMKDGKQADFDTRRIWRERNWIVEYDRERGCWIAYGIDGELDRQIRSASFRESWEQYDPELAEREILPKEKRRDLSRTPNAIALPPPEAPQP